jgi:hypothetical protein
MDKFGFQTFAFSATGDVDYEGNPVGPDSEFQASFGDDTLVITGDVTFGALEAEFGPTPTAGNLLQAMFNALEADAELVDPDLESNFNLLEDAMGNPILITFAFPAVTTNPFVENFSSDTAAIQTLGIAAADVEDVPEPSAAITTITGLGCLVAFAFVKRAWARRAVH